MTDQNQDNQNPKPEGEQQPYMPPPVPQQETPVEEPQAQQPTEPVQQQPQPQVQPQQAAYQQQATQGQATYQGQPNYGQQGGGYTQQGNYGGVPPQDMPDTYMTLSIIATVVGWLTCCTSSCIGGIVGIVAIVFASQVTSKYAMGDLRGAKSSSETAKILAIVSFAITGLSIIGYILYFIVILQAGGLEDVLNTYKEALEQAR